MSLNNEEAQKNLREPEIDLDNLLTNFLDKEIGTPSEKGELAPDLDQKLKETLREIGMVNSGIGTGLGARETSSPPEETDSPPLSYSNEELAPEESANLSQSVVPLIPLPDTEELKHEPVVNSTANLGFTVQKAQLPEKLAIRFHIPILAATVAGLLAILGVGGYVWLIPHSGEMQRKSTTTSQSETEMGRQVAVPGLSVTGPETNPVSSSQNTIQKTELHQPLTSNQDPDGKGGLVSRAAISPTSSSNPAPIQTLDSRTSTVRTVENQSPAQVPASPPLPPAAKAMIPDLPSPEGNTAIALKDLALPKSPLDSASQPQVAPPMGMPVEKVHTAVVTPAVALSRIQVVYPEMAKQTRIKGNVDVEYSIDENGKVMAAKAKNGPMALRRAAEDAVYRTRFKPATSNGTNVPANGKITLVFNLENQ